MRHAGEKVSQQYEARRLMNCSKVDLIEIQSTSVSEFQQISQTIPSNIYGCFTCKLIDSGDPSLYHVK